MYDTYDLSTGAEVTVMYQGNDLYKNFEVTIKKAVNYLKQISPVSVMFGCQILVKHFTFGGCQNTKQRLQCCPYK